MKIVNVIVAIVSGIIVLLGYFFKLPELENLRASLLNWALVLSGVAGLVAILNLIFSVHWKRVRNKHPRKGASLIIIILLASLSWSASSLVPPTPVFKNL